MLGVSYDGWTTIMGALEPHPALKAISPQASPSDMWLGDDFHHNGAFRLSYGLEYAYWLESGKNLEPFGFDRYDTYQWYLALGPLSNVNALFFHGKIPTWNDFVAHPDYDAFWKKQTVIPHLREVAVPTLNVAGWWDQEDFFGPLQIYAALEKHDPKDLNRLVVGPWNHGGWTHGDGDRLGAIPFDSATAKYFREEIQAPWFAHYLKDRGIRRPSRGPDLRGRHEPVAAVGGLAAGRAHRGPQPLLRRRTARSPSTRRRRARPRSRGLRRLRLRPRAPGPVPAAPDPDDVLSGRLEVADVARRGPALRRRPGRRPDLRVAAADRGRDDRRRGRRAPLRLDHRERRRLGRQAHRRLPGAVPGELGPRGL